MRTALWRARRIGAYTTVTGAILLATACEAPLSTFSRASTAAERISFLTWFMTILSGVVFLVVMALMVAAVRHHCDRDAAGVDVTDRDHAWLIWGGAVMPALVLLTVFLVGLAAMRRPVPDPDRPVLTIHVIGHQWWWELLYEDASGTRFATANELHIPVGQPVRLRLTSADVIHSFWVPRLQGKQDLIPGDTNELYLEARRAATYGGTCAEYCGAQHAHMGFAVIAEDTAAFREWASRQSEVAETPRDSLAAVGRQVFIRGPCAACHTVRGTPATGTTAPDLTHVAARRTLAAGTLPNSLGHLAGWIANPQALKPGALMPTLRAFTGPDLRALAAYVSSLK
ncbi:MAG: cytochrome c oxidase subunit II [Gemmatimonadaceae bacterium]